ncbi:MAG: hypothetical protein KC621_17775 [Myxococcales bacterium]|nr:hypothetical protein [Myxococcales bacterium]
MGHGRYSQDIAHARRNTAPQWQERAGVHPALDPKAGPREVNNETPIVVAMDVTRSRGDDTKRLYDQLPTLMKRLEERGWVDGPGISFAAVGDADADRAPLQVGQFEGDNRLDEVLTNVWIEEGGGGTGQESYELCAWYYAGTDCVRQREGTGGKGFFFFVGDEGFYPVVAGEHREKVLGQPAEDVDAAEAFRALQQKFQVFLVYPGKSMAERKADIDAEIRKRVLAAGGQHDNVDVRISLVWDDRNDLDLHVTTPSGEVIYFGNKASRCGGLLDVDRNVRGETTTPVENVRWARGSAPAGSYAVKVRNYAFHEPSKAPSPWRVEVENGGELLFFEGVSSPAGQTGPSSDREVCTFTFEPNEAARAEQYRAYSDDVVLAQWRSVLPEGRVLVLRDAANITTTLLGALALSNGRADRDTVRARMVEDGLSPEAIEDVMAALSGL